MRLYLAHYRSIASSRVLADKITVHVAKEITGTAAGTISISRPPTVEATCDDEAEPASWPASAPSTSATLRVRSRFRAQLWTGIGFTFTALVIVEFCQLMAQYGFNSDDGAMGLGLFVCFNIGLHILRGALKLVSQLPSVRVAAGNRTDLMHRWAMSWT